MTRATLAEERAAFLATPMMDVGMSVKAAQALERAGVGAALTVAAARDGLIAYAGGDWREVFARLCEIKYCGPATAREICDALGFRAPAPAKHCPSCTCKGHK